MVSPIVFLFFFSLCVYGGGAGSYPCCTLFLSHSGNSSNLPVDLASRGIGLSRSSDWSWINLEITAQFYLPKFWRFTLSKDHFGTPRARSWTEVSARSNSSAFVAQKSSWRITVWRVSSAQGLPLLTSRFLSGFTSLCETYGNLAKADVNSCGTEKLTQTLNTYIGKIVRGKSRNRAQRPCLVSALLHC